MRVARIGLLLNLSLLLVPLAIGGVVAPIYEVTGLNGVGPRAEEAGLGLIAGYAFSAPYEDVKLKGK